MRSRWRRLLTVGRGDGRRTAISAVGATVLTAVVVTLWITIDKDMIAYAFVLGCIVAWALLSGISAGLAHLAFRGLRGAELTEALGVRHPGRRQEDLSATTVQLSALALVVVGLLAFLPGVRSEQGLVAAGLVMVALSWVNVVVNYAIHYARLDLADPSLRFPGQGEASYVRYLYFSLAIQSTFGTTDVEVETDRLRKITMTHGLLAFTFNTVILAVIVSMLLGG
ncbi:MAG: DUF1345 domain-containing protein [Propionibacteriales bacterium]|nr:DUF1345 domain-containing protein [Propionibacteriales bacterium]